MWATALGDADEVRWMTKDECPNAISSSIEIDAPTIVPVGCVSVWLSFCIFFPLGFGLCAACDT